MKAALYLRVSCDKQSTDMQRRDLITYCKDHNLTFDIYEDTLTGTTAERSQLNRLIENIKQYQKIIVWKSDRLARNTRDFLNMHFEFEKAKVELISLKDHFDSTPGGILLMQIQAAVAENEARNIRMRVRAGMANAKINGTKSGKPIGRPAKTFCLETYMSLEKRGLSVSEIALHMGYSKSQMYRIVGRLDVKDAV